MTIRVLLVHAAGVPEIRDMDEAQRQKLAEILQAGDLVRAELSRLQDRVVVLYSNADRDLGDEPSFIRPEAMAPVYGPSLVAMEALSDGALISMTDAEIVVWMEKILEWRAEMECQRQQPLPNPFICPGH